MLSGAYEILFENIHKKTKKCTPKQTTFYQIALNMHKVLNDTSLELKTETVRVLNQVACTSRQTMFECFRTDKY